MKERSLDELIEEAKKESEKIRLLQLGLVRTITKLVKVLNESTTKDGDK